MSWFTDIEILSFLNQFFKELLHKGFSELTLWKNLEHDRGKKIDMRYAFGTLARSHYIQEFLF